MMTQKLYHGLLLLSVAVASSCGVPIRANVDATDATALQLPPTPFLRNMNSTAFADFERRDSSGSSGSRSTQPTEQETQRLGETDSRHNPMSALSRLLNSAHTNGRAKRPPSSVAQNLLKTFLDTKYERAEPPLTAAKKPPRVVATPTVPTVPVAPVGSSSKSREPVWTNGATWWVSPNRVENNVAIWDVRTLGANGDSDLSGVYMTGIGPELAIGSYGTGPDRYYPDSDMDDDIMDASRDDDGSGSGGGGGDVWDE
jgi:hypothetical protein